MARNVEIKARVNNPAGLLERVKNLSNTPGEWIEQEDIFFNLPSGRLKLRLLGPNQGQLIYYQRADTSGPRLSDYQIHPVSDPESLRSILSKSLGERGTVRKRRRLFWVSNTRIHLDEVEGLGSFVELEVTLEDNQTKTEGETIAAGLMDQLGIEAGELIEGAYIDLLESA